MKVRIISTPKQNTSQNAATWNHATGGPLANAPLDGPIEQPHSVNLDPLTEFNEGGKHEENPNGGIPQGTNPNGVMNTVEEGETKLNSKNYIFSDTLKIDKSIADAYYLPSKFIGKTFAEVSKAMNRPNSRRQEDAIEKNAIIKDLDGLMHAQEDFKQASLQKDMESMMIKHSEFMQQMMSSQQPVVDSNSVNPEQVESIPSGVPDETPMAKMGGFQNQMDFGGYTGQQGGNGFAEMSADNIAKTNQQGFTNQDNQSRQNIYAGTDAVTGAISTAIPVAKPFQIAGKALRGVGDNLTTDQNTGQIDRSSDTGKEALGNFASYVADPFSREMSYLKKKDFKGALSEGLTMGMTDNLFGQHKMGGYLYGNDNAGNSTTLAEGGSLNYPTYDPNSPDNHPMSLNYGNINTDEERLPLKPVNNVAKNYWDPSTSFASMDMINKDVPAEPITTDDVLPTKQSYANTSVEGKTANIKGFEAEPNQEVKQSGLNVLGTYAPVAYNLGMGLFSKPQQLNYKDYINNKQLANWRNNINSQIKATEEAFASGANGVRNSGAGGGSYLANLQQLAAGKAQAVAGINADAENAYNDRQLQIDQINAARGDQNAQMRLQIADWNAKSKAAKRNYTQEGVKQLGQISQSDTANNLGMAYANLNAPDYANKMVYKNWLDSILKK